MKSTVVSVRQSPMNETRWMLTLACGHHVWITCNNRPSRKTENCTEDHAAETQGVLDQPIFGFSSFHDWVDNASKRFRNHGVSCENTVCYDTKGRLVQIGKDFQRAHDEFAFPVKVYRKVKP